ncbi:MAG: hydrogenase maturation nickel metallochaperone HypA, partial [Chloroflexota bacterium]
MHELALSRAIVDAALRHAEGRPVERVHVRLGDLRQASPGSLAFYFEIVARDTDCEGAELEIETLTGDQLEVAWIDVTDTARRRADFRRIATEIGPSAGGV